MTLAALLMAFALVEGLLQLAALASPRIALLLSPGIPRAIPDVRLGSRPNPALPDHDASGYRNPVVLERADIVVLGDSQTYGSEVSRKNAWPTLLGEELGVSTYNMAFSGWGPAQYYLIADEALALNPRLLVVGLYAGNDFANAYRDQRKVPELRAESAHDLEFFETYDEEAGALGEAWKASQAARRGAFRTWSDPFVQPLEEHLKIWGLIRGLLRIESAEYANVRTDSVYDDIDKYVAEIAHLPRGFYFPFRNDRVGTVFTPTRRASVVNLEDPRIVEGVRISLLVLDRLRERCGARCELVVVTIPTKEFAFREAVEESGIEAPAAYKKLLVDEAAIWQHISRELDAQEIIRIDALVPLDRTIREGRNPYRADWDGHPNGLGNHVIAAYVAAHPTLRALLGEPIAAHPRTE